MTKQEALELYEKMSYKKKVEVLWDALDLMQQYNGRTRYECIALALGVEVSDL